MGVIQKQGIQNTVVTYLGILIGFVNLIILQPVFLTTEEIGLTRILFSFSSLVAVFLPLGVASITIRYFPLFRNAEKKHHGFFGFMLLFPIAGAVLTAIVLYLLRDFFISQYIKESHLFTEYFDYVMPFSFLLGLISVLNVYSFSLFKTTFPSLLNDIVTRLLSMIVISIYFLRWIAIDQFIFLFVFIYGVQLIALLIYIFSVDKPGLKINFQFLKQQNISGILSYGFLLSFASIASYGLKYLDAIMIGKYLPLSQVGVYTIAAFIPVIIEAPINSLEKITYTKIADALATNNQKEMKEIYYKSARYMLLLGGLLFLGVNINIESLLKFLPDEYSNGINVVMIMSLGTLCTMTAGSNNPIISNSKNYKFGAFMLMFLVLLTFAGNIIFIPIYGIEGAALATASSTFIYSFIKYLFIWKTYRLQPFDRKTGWVICLITLCFILNYFFPGLDKPLYDIIFRSALITIAYTTGVWFLKIVPEFHQYVPFIGKK